MLADDTVWEKYGRKWREREGLGAVSPPGGTSGGIQKRQGATKKHSYLRISDRD